MRDAFPRANPVITGLERLLAAPPAWWRQARLGLVSHSAAITRQWQGSAEALRAAGYQLTALFAPEHGYDGAATAGDPVGHAVDARLGLPVFSLYGASAEPQPEALELVDVLVVDLQDVGARFYTYSSTVVTVMRAAARAGKPVWVLDRPNPITGTIVEGPLLTPGFESFVSLLPVPIRHGLTLGELAQLANSALQLRADLHIEPAAGWRRHAWADETGLPWVPPSPAMPHLSTATLYPGTCLLEGVNVSAGRGTALPFEVVGAPWLEREVVAHDLNALELEGLHARPHCFTPATGRYAGTLCHGLQLHVTNRLTCRPVTVVMHLLALLQQRYPNDLAWDKAHFDRLAGGDATRLHLSRGGSATELILSWEEDLRRYNQTRLAFLINDAPLSKRAPSTAGIR
jgi:uncharacterized protein YbbC (DUF1343 family)